MIALVAINAICQHVTLLGPTAGYFPDPMFARNVDVVGGRYVSDARLLLKRIAERKQWYPIPARERLQWA